ncbi:MAG: response regulator [Sphaerochaetaceae bacterium]
MRIVIIDDEIVICKGLAKLVKNYSKEIEIVGIYSDSEEAKELCNWSIIDLIFMDINMPGLNGFQLLQEVRDLGYNPLFLVISGHAEFEFARKALKNSAVDFILKPIIPEKLYQALDEAETLLKKKEIDQFLTNNKNYIEYSKFAEFLFDTVNYSYEQMDKLLENLQLKGSFFVIELLYLKEELNFQIKSYDDNTQIFNFLVGTNIYSILLVTKNPDYNSVLDNFNTDIKIKFPNSNRSSEYVSKNIKEIHQLFAKGLCELSTKYNQSDFDNNNKLNNNTKEKKYSSIINQAIEKIYKSYSKPLSLSQIADDLEIHPTYLSNLFKKETNHTFVEFLNTYRIEKAKEVLEDPLAKIWWVSEKVGFADQKYFSQVFKKTTGITPLEFRTNYYFNHC